ncbi:MAG: sterol desaturase family protein [Pleurocapsa sp. SU_5_0]|nr:sterol desaturase family protein [Pleurocapsa sp. SU_5_0]
MKLWLYYLITFFVIILTRYLLVAGGTYWLFYASEKSIIKQSLALKHPQQKLIQKDIALSITATVATAICAALVMTIYDFGATRLYSSVEDYGTWYLIVSFFGVILLQDTSYYFFHRGLHHPLVYNWLHRGHHRSKNPTPWTSFALDFPEALIQGLFLVVIVFIVPIHFAVLALWLITMTIWSLMTHLGFELFPTFPSHWFGKWLISSDHHSLHHRQYSKHYGLYFTFWDRLLGTN